MKIVKMEVCEAIINLMEVVGIELVPPKYLQNNEIIAYYL
jgi:hypothetical protein